MALHRIESLLKKSIGLNPLSIGHSTIERAVQARMKMLAVDGAHQYADLLARSDSELEALLEGVTVPETWFFRDPAAYEFLGAHVRAAVPGRKGGLRILSLPCSSGEEPYSIAMTLALAGIEDYSILAVDIRHAALAQARAASYGTGSFRGKDLQFRDIFFESQEQRFQLSPRIVSKVEFRYGNILDPLLLSREPAFDLVFCRNLLIYLDSSARRLASAQVDRWLDDDGILFSGHAESTFAWGQRFVSLRQARAFVYRKNPDFDDAEDASWERVVPMPSRAFGGGSE